VEAVDRLTLGYRLAGSGEIAQALQHAGGRAGDDGRVEAGGSGSELGAQRAGDLIVRSAGVIVVYAGKAVDLQIDEAGGEVKGSWLGGWYYGLDDILKAEFDAEAGQSVDAGTL